MWAAATYIGGDASHETYGSPYIRLLAHCKVQIQSYQTWCCQDVAILTGMPIHSELQRHSLSPWDNEQMLTAWWQNLQLFSHHRSFRLGVWTGKLHLSEPYLNEDFFFLEIRSSTRWTSHDFLAVRGMFFSELYASHIDFASHEITNMLNMKLGRFRHQFSHLHLCRRISQSLVIGQWNGRRNSMSINAKWCIWGNSTLAAHMDWQFLN